LCAAVGPESIMGVTRSSKLGFSSLLLFAGFIVLPFWAGNLPFGWIFAVISSVLGWLASRQGTKWWLLIPGSIVALVVFIAVVTFHQE
jgi:hypothetical protein